MQFCLRLIVCGAVALAPIALHAQESATSSVAANGPEAGTTSSVSKYLPDAPAPVSAGVVDQSQTQQTQQPGTGSSTPNNAGQSTSQGSSSSQTPAAPADTTQSQHDKAEEQLKQQEKQRVMGVMATFNTTRNKDAVPLSSGQKYKLFFKSATDPWPFLLAGAVAGIGQAENSTPEWGQGAQGYGKRIGAGYSDYFIGNFFGNAVLPSLMHEDPRYFQKGSGSAISRILWAAASTVWCKRDNGGWGPNWSNVAGNMIGAAIGRVYYPPSDRTVSGTISDGFTVSAEGVVGAEVIEFWPDMVRSHNRKKAEKLARQAAQKDAQDAAKQQQQKEKTDHPQ